MCAMHYMLVASCVCVQPGWYRNLCLCHICALSYNIFLRSTAGGGFVAGHALMYLGSYTYWLNKLAQQGIACSILSVEYPLAPEHPFPAAVEAAAGVIEWLVHDSRETVPYIVGKTLAERVQTQQD